MNGIAFGDKLRQLREKKDISVRELARRIGVSAAFLSDVELGRRFPSPDKLELLAKELGVKADELRDFDFRDEADNIKKMMFADAAVGLAFRTFASRIKEGVPPEEILKKLSPKKRK